ncbi:MAG TPA: alpha/beta-type small acid-soluble spore protein [Candidatus Choladousia intestinigallinarum]|nr:alpha/beta-type small acid-soluble spore protein [Candidatus Choladousia intestinigallinarum]
MSNRSSNTTAVPEAKSAMDRFKFEVANELGVPLTDGYNGNLTSRQNGSVGGYMVKKMIEAQERQMSGTSQMPGASQMSGTGTMQM